MAKDDKYRRAKGRKVSSKSNKDTFFEKRQTSLGKRIPEQKVDEDEDSENDVVSDVFLAHQAMTCAPQSLTQIDNESKSLYIIF